MACFGAAAIRALTDWRWDFRRADDASEAASDNWKLSGSQQTYARIHNPQHATEMGDVGFHA